MTEKNTLTKVADLCDAFARSVRVLAPIFSDFGGKKQFNGKAVTVKCDEDNSVIKTLSLTPGLGRIMVIDGGANANGALLGDTLATNMINNGWQGAIINGYIRDKAELAKLPIGIKALGAMPFKSQKISQGTFGEAIEIAGQTIVNGDHIYADEDGVIVLNKAN